MFVRTNEQKYREAGHGMFHGMFVLGQGLDRSHDDDELWSRYVHDMFTFHDMFHDTICLFISPDLDV